MSLEKRAAERRKRIVGHIATSFEDAEDWDLRFWQGLTPQDRLSALVAIHRDIAMVEAGRRYSHRASRKGNRRQWKP